MRLLLSLFAMLASAAAFALPAPPLPPVPVYGGLDDRLDFTLAEDPRVLEAASSTVALVPQWKLPLDPQSGRYVAKAIPLKGMRKLCPEETFLEQPALAACSGALVGPDLVLTAGHCVPTAAKCKDLRFVFGYALGSEGAAPEGFDPAEVYGCRRIAALKRVKGQADYALVQLDRAVEGHAPLAVDRDPEGAGIGDELLVAGYPMGLPLKIVGGARARANFNRSNFLADLDAFHGNSGSPVLDARTLQVVGILTDGEADFVLDKERGCLVTRRCVMGELNCKGERVMRIREAARKIPKP